MVRGDRLFMCNKSFKNGDLNEGRNSSFTLFHDIKLGAAFSRMN